MCRTMIHDADEPTDEIDGRSAGQREGRVDPPTLAIPIFFGLVPNIWVHPV